MENEITEKAVNENPDEVRVSGEDDSLHQDKESEQPAIDSIAEKKRNSENARRRREEERQRELKETRIKAVIDTLGGKNPYNGEPIEDETDVQEYFTMRDIAAKGGDPLADFASQRKQEEKARLKESHRQAEEKAWFKADSARFSERFPDVDVAKLSEDEIFVKYAGGKIGRIPLAEIYEDYLEFSATVEKKSKEAAARMVANANASPGSLSGGGTSEIFFTREQVKKMSREEVRENYEQIRKSMQKWR